MIIFHSNKTNSNIILVSGQLNSVDIKMELDTSAARSLSSTTDHETFWTRCNKPKIPPITETLRVYGDTPVPIVSEISIEAMSEVNSQSKNVKFSVVQGHELIMSRGFE